MYENFRKSKGKGKAVPLQAWTSLEGSSKLRLPDFVTTAQDGGKVVSLMHRPFRRVVPPKFFPAKERRFVYVPDNVKYFNAE